MLHLANLSRAVFASNFVGRAWSEAQSWVNGLDRQAWLLILCVVVVIGALCLRGFGSRSNY